MLKTLRALLRTETVDDITAALASIDLPALRTAHQSAIAARAELLLTGTDGQLLKAEADIDTARLAVDRAEAALGALESKLITAQAAKAEAEFRAKYDAAVDERDAVVQLINKEYAAAARKVLAVLSANQAAAPAIKSINEACLDDEAYGLPVIATPSQLVWGSQFSTISLGIADISSFTTLLPTATSPAIDPNAARG